MKVVVYAFYGGALGCLLLALRELFLGLEENRCSMTYMFEYPEYRRVQLPRYVARQYPAYGLYLYGEGVYAQETRGLKLTGAPVLFLPGNAGSYKQGRSLGSVALRKAENMEGGIHLNVFTIDFNEELVALYGGGLLRQTHFLHESIKVILRLYKDRPDPPQSVVLVGHSMGGVVARALFTLPGFSPGLVSLILTQASPHQAPVLSLDPYILEFYSSVSRRWSTEAEDLRNVTVLSVGGGYRDYQVRSGLTALSCSADDPNKMAVVVSETKFHICFVYCWCKELVLATVRAFFDLIEPETRQVNVVELYFYIVCLVCVYRVHVPVSRSDVFVAFDSKIKKFVLHLRCNYSNTNLNLAGLTTSDITINSSGLLHTIQLKHFHQVKLSSFLISVDRLPNIYRIKVPWFREDSFVTAGIPSVTEMSGMLHTSRHDNTSSALLQLHTSPNCQYKVIFHSVTVELPILILHLSLRHVQPLKRASVHFTVGCLNELPSIITMLFLFNRQGWFQEGWTALGLPDVDMLPLTTTEDISQDAAGSWQYWPHLVSLLLCVLGAAVAFWGSAVLSASVHMLSFLLGPLHRYILSAFVHMLSFLLGPLHLGI
uniref:GPI inositol-deacylase n=1 Tax=Electrophorus electricus TaxID=8005 RepID=A0A4W4DUL8_ELEEL